MARQMGYFDCSAVVAKGILLSLYFDVIQTHVHWGKSEGYLDCKSPEPNIKTSCCDNKHQQHKDRYFPA